MTAPTPAQLLQFIDQKFQQRGSGGNQYFDKVTQAISDGWASWEKSLIFGSVSVTGTGAGAWSGTGLGGVMSGPPFVLPPVAFDAQDPKQVKLLQGLRSSMPQFFQSWASTYKFSALPFAGTSTATGSNPGNVNATNVSTPLSTAGKGKAPSAALPGQKLADAWLATLTLPDFDLSAPKGKTGELVSAISGSIEQAFDTIWLLGAHATANLLKGAAANGGVVAGLATATNGKVS